MKISCSSYDKRLTIFDDFAKFLESFKSWENDTVSVFNPIVILSRLISVERDWSMTGNIILQKIVDFFSNFLTHFLIKIPIFEEYSDVLPELLFLNKILIFDQKFNFWQKLRFSFKVSIFGLKFRFLV